MTPTFLPPPHRPATNSHCVPEAFTFDNQPFVVSKCILVSSHFSVVAVCSIYQFSDFALGEINCQNTKFKHKIGSAQRIAQVHHSHIVYLDLGSTGIQGGGISIHRILLHPYKVPTQVIWFWSVQASR